MREAEKANAHLANPKAVTKPWWLTGAEFGISSAAQIGGEAAGAAIAAPAAVGEAATGVGVPAAGLTEAAGAAAGAGVGSVAGDVANRALERATGYGKAPIIPTAGEAAKSAALGAAGSVGGKVLGGIASRLTGLRTARGAVSEAAAKQAATEADTSAIPGALKRMEQREKIVGGAADKFTEEFQKGVSTQAKEQVEREAPLEVGKAVGLSPDEAKAAAERSFEERSTIGAAGRAAVKEARGARIKETGELFNPIYDPIKDNIVPHEELVSTATQSTNAIGNALAKQGITTPAGQKAALDALSPDARGYLAQIARMGSLTRTGDVTASVKESTLGEIRKLNAGMIQLAAKSNDPTERALLRTASQPFRDVLDAAVPEEQKPLLASLKQQYAQINRELPFSLAKRIDKATTLPEMGNILYGDPKKLDRAVELWKAANPEQKSLMKQMFAHDLMTNHGATAQELGKALEGRGRVMKMMFGDDAFAQAQTWVNVEARRAATEKLIAQSPSARQQYESGLKQAIAEASRDFKELPIKTLHQKLTQDELNKTAEDALREHAKMGRMASYMQHHLGWSLLVGGVYGVGSGHWGPLAAEVGVLGPYFLRRQAWISAMDNPAFAAGYRKAIMSPNVQKAGYLIGRLMTTAAVEAAKGEPSQQ